LGVGAAAAAALLVADAVVAVALALLVAAVLAPELLALVTALLVAAVLALAAGLLVAAVLTLALGAAVVALLTVALPPPQAARDTAPSPATMVDKKRRRERSALDVRPTESMQHPPLQLPRHTIKGHGTTKRDDRLGKDHIGLR
jgi:hypothetical protein